MQKRFRGSLSDIIPCKLPDKILLTALLCILFLFFTSDSFAFTLSDTVNDAVSSIKGMAQSIASAVSSTADFISGIKSLLGFLGFGTIILLLSVLLLTSGLSATGLSTGKKSFFLALFIADVIWLCCKIFFGSFGEMEDIFSFGLYFAKTNLLILCPFILMWLIKTYCPLLKNRLKRTVFRISAQDLAYTRKAAGASGRALAEQALKLSTAIQENLNRSSSSTGMNSETGDAITQIKKLISELDKAQNNKIRKQKNETTSESR